MCGPNAKVNGTMLEENTVRGTATVDVLHVDAEKPTCLQFIVLLCL